VKERRWEGTREEGRNDIDEMKREKAEKWVGREVEGKSERNGTSVGVRWKGR